MTHILESTRQVVAALKAAGVRATDDPRNVAPPCVWVEYSSSTRYTAARTSVTVNANLIVPGPGNSDALAALDQLYAQVTPALDAAAMPWTDSALQMTASPQTGEPLPSLALTITRTMEV